MPQNERPAPAAPSPPSVPSTPFRPGLAVAALVGAVALAVLPAGCTAASRDPAGAGPQPTPAGTAARATGPLPVATTFGRLGAAAPRDPHPGAATDGTAVHPRRAVRVYAKPGGAAFARLPATQLGSPTWVPVVARRPGWVRVLLPARPNGTAGWLAAGSALDTARSPYRIDVDIAARRLTLYEDGRATGAWTVAVGKAGTPTPRGRTFVMASIVDREATYTPLILPLGTHSATLDRFGGGPGTVALHGWPDGSVFGHAVSNGCIRVPSVTLSKLRAVPLGSLVLLH